MKAALYIRVSTEEQAEEGFSIQAQINQLTDYCKKNNIEVFKPYIDEGVSAKYTDEKKRPQFNKMISDAEKKLFNIILVHKYDRFARNVELSQKVKRRLKTAGINVLSMTEPIEDSPIGFFQEGILELLAEYYIRNLAQEVKKGMRERVKSGMHNGSVPYGYRTDKASGIMVPHEEQAPVVRKIFQLYNEGMGSAQISKWLDEHGISSAIQGAKWNHYAVLYILKNVKYIGYIKHANEIYRGVHQPIVDEETFNLAQTHRAGRYLEREPVGKNEQKFMLLGLLKCGVCGHKFGIRSRPDTRCKQPIMRNYYTCARSKAHENHIKCAHSKFYPADKLEQAVLDKYASFLNGLATQEIKVQKLNLPIDTQINEVKAETARAENLYLKGHMSEDRYIELKTRNDKLLIKLTNKRTESKLLPIINAKDEMSKILSEPSPSKRRLHMRKYVKEIVLYPDGNTEFNWI